MAALKHGSRKFYDIPRQEYSRPKGADRLHAKQSVEELLRYIDESCVGKETTFSGPFGARKVVYCDYTASGRSLSFIEDYIREEVLPHYGNTHTTSTVTSLQTTMYRHEARDIIRNAVNAGEGDAIIFTGSGCTAAVHKLIHALDLKEPPIVFVGTYEHHSSLLPWRELGSQMVWIDENQDGLVDVQNLERKLKEHARSGRQLIGCFAAASNVTGVLTDTNSITAVLHRHGALVFWDYATAGPYVEINMNPLVLNEDQALVYKDAVFISPHKFIGGVGTPGILVAKKKLFRNPVPSGCGGGSVFFVTNDSHRYLKETEMREEGGTPAIVESIRAGLVFQLKQAVGTDTIMNKERELHRKAVHAWSNQESLLLLGNTLVPRLPVFSFLIRHSASGLFLHHNFVSTLLNDLFGIQTRGGCMCAGPYAQNLLGIDDDLAHEIEALLLEDSRLDRSHLRRYHEYSEREALRPGFVRLNLPYFMSDGELDFVLKAVQMVATRGWKLLPQYMFNPETGEWRHRRHQVFRDRKWLGSISYTSGHMTYPRSRVFTEEAPKDLQECLSRAEDVFSQAAKTCKTFVSASDQSLLLGDAGEAMRWFLLPSEAADLLCSKAPAHLPKRPRFVPRVWDTHTRGSDVDEEKEPCDMQPDVWQSKDLDEGPAISGEVDRVPVTENVCSATGVENYPREIRDSASRNEAAAIQTSYPDSLDQDTREAVNEAALCRASTGPEGKSGVTNCTGGEKYVDAGQNDPPTVTRREFGDNCARSAALTETAEKSETETPSLRDGDTRRCASCVETPDGSRNSVASERASGTPRGMACEANREARENETKGSSPAVVCERKDRKQKERGNAGKIMFHSPPKSIFKPTAQAIEDFNMIRAGDRVLVCLSGGKDSLSLLHTLRQYQFLARAKGISFEFGAATVDPQSAAYDPRPLVPYLAALQIPYFFEEQEIIQQAADLPECESICSFCSRMKRGRLYACARREGYNVLALGQHLDDLAESFVMSTFHNGLLRTMKANYTVREGDLRVIRPLVYVREKELRTFAEKCRLPVIAENCPACFEAPKERHRTKQLLAAQEILFPGLFNSMLTAMRPLMAKDRVGLESGKMKAGNYDDFL